jgi:hypothetical protein
MEKNLEELKKEELIELARQLIARIEELVVENAELKSRLNQNSSNSSTPPSANPYNKPKSLKEKSGKKPGGQPGHKGHGLSLPHNVNRLSGNSVQQSDFRLLGLSLIIKRNTFL